MFGGAPYAFVLRRDGPHKRYRLLGDAHVSGLPAHIHVTESNFGDAIRWEAEAVRDLPGGYPKDYNEAGSEDLHKGWGWITLV